MQVALMFQWFCEDQLQPPLWKLVSFPCLPPVNCRVFLIDDDGCLNEGEVVRIAWDENRPELFDVELAVVDNIADTAEEFRDYMESLGWSEIHPAAN